MSVSNIPAPPRYLVAEEEGAPPRLEDCTGVRDMIYIVGIDSPWIGATIEEIEQWTNEGGYGTDVGLLKMDIARAKAGLFK